MSTFSQLDASESEGNPLTELQISLLNGFVGFENNEPIINNHPGFQNNPESESNPLTELQTSLLNGFVGFESKQTKTDSLDYEKSSIYRIAHRINRAEKEMAIIKEELKRCNDRYRELIEKQKTIIEKTESNIKGNRYRFHMHKVPEQGTITPIDSFDNLLQNRS